ncbi:Holliday junction resolvase RuvX [Candidatus Uhrbacteria bacterium]|nr:Holliday junction resolvase RuvX [Candidatus Uhrbacteria bacterium]
MRIIGIDYGLARIGSAIWDSQADLVLPLGVIAERDFKRAVSAVAGLCLEERADLVVVGLPKRLSGEGTGEQVGRTERFVAALRDETGLPIEMEDERMTSGVAESQRRHAKPGQVAERDALAAVAILESHVRRGIR